MIKNNKTSLNHTSHFPHPTSQNGITIIALIITIILMLILATISVNVAINGGLFEKASDAVSRSEIANEKDTVVKANILAKSKSQIITLEDLQKALDSITDENAATAMDNGETIVVKFNKNDRYYEIENSGKVQGPIEFVKDDYAGDITKGGAYDGSADKPFKITCIEDLVAFSIMSNGGNSELGLEASQFSNQYIELTKSLDFKSIFSYNDYKSKDFGDLNENGVIEEIKIELTNKDNEARGFTGIGEKSYPKSFAGTFDGNNFQISNIYINKKYDSIQYYITGGLFGFNNGTIKNLILGKGQIIVENYNTVGGICGTNDVNGKIINCINKADIFCTNTAGGVAGYSNGVIEMCGNEGRVTGASKVGGICGYEYGPRCGFKN